ncbi:MAG: phosphoribosylanthranilate isomerase [Candidatus Bathyarchaeia archaeon]|nr:phosphoribosylanthranilate isomerase [Candidatus Bathyarchaeota archaeon]
MRKVRVKICGITRLEDANVSVKAGADSLGFIVDVPESPRNISFELAKQIMKATPIFVTKVAVTVFKSLERTLEIYRELRPDAVQLHGKLPSLEDIDEISRRVRVIGAVRADPDIALEGDMLHLIDRLDAVLVDTHLPGIYGGTGITHDWSMSRRIRDTVYPKPMILAGGLRPENVRSAIITVEPFAVDVSSGVEAYPGIKDAGKIFSFISEVRRAEECLS